MKKKIIIILSIIIVLIFSFIVSILYELNYIPHKKYSNKDFNITTYKSEIDKDPMILPVIISV